MGVDIYNWYARTDIDCNVAQGATALGACPCFLLSPCQLICLSHIPADASQSEFAVSSTSLVNWTPQSDTINRLTGKLPPELESAFSSDSCERLFFVTRDAQEYMYLGNIDFVGVTTNEQGRLTASFVLRPPLSSDAWAMWGGGQTWQCLLNGQDVEIVDFDRLLSSKEPPILEVFLSRRGGNDYIHLVANNDLAYVRYIDRSSGVSLSSCNSKSTSSEIVTLAGFGGSDWDVERRHIVARREGIQIMASFYRSGGKPAGLSASKE
jgi:hypothetical protein